MTTTSFENLLVAAGSGKRTPPVERWNPELCGTIDIRIAADGTWFHEGRAHPAHTACQAVFLAFAQR
jgi:hypothetical protein